MEASQEITALLLAWGDGDPAALEKPTPLIYDDLHKKARHYIPRENPGNLLQTTALIIVADTTPIHYLILIGEAEVLKEMFGRVIVPQAVVDELTRDRTPQTVRDWIDSQPMKDVIEEALERDRERKESGKQEQ
jgi:hypothetical protein